jgi:hypothetical protein
MSAGDIIDRMLKLHDELYALRASNKRLALDDMQRWSNSLRANGITEELKLLRAEYESKMGVTA